MEKKKFIKWIPVVVLVCISILALVASLVAPHDPYGVDLTKVFMSPSRSYPLGTDALGRCVFSRLLCGASRSIYSVALVVLITFVFGSILGIICGYFGGLPDRIIMRIVDIFLAFPGMVLAIAVAGVLGGGLINAMVAVGAINWTKYTRLARGRVMELKKETFIEATRISGKGNLHIIVHHIIPNVAGYLIVTASSDMGTVMMEMASLSFLGLSSPLPLPEWGAMISEGKGYLQFAPWLVIAPGMAIFLVVVLFNLTGDTLRDYFQTN